MPRPALPDSEKKVVQVIRISPIARQRLESLPTSKKKIVIAAMREAVELVINSMTNSALHSNSENFFADKIKDNFLVDGA